MLSFNHLILRGVSMAALAALMVPSAGAEAQAPDSRQAAAPAAKAHGSVTIKRDGYGVPHIYAKTTYGLLYGFGYAVAEDQLFQMEMLRRTARGSVAEVLGSKYLDQDRAVRSASTPALLEQQYRALGPEDRAIFEGYAAGFNARVRDALAARDTLLPREFSEFGFDPVEWAPLDVVAVFVHSIPLRFADNNMEIANLGLLTQLKAQHGEEKGWQIFEQLRWEHDRLAPTTLSKDDEVAAPPPTFAARRSGAGANVGASAATALAGLSNTAFEAHKQAQLRAYGGLGPDTFPHASNIWLVGAKKTKGGEAVLVNGPQMGDFSPGYIWAAGLHGAGYDMVGSGPMGSPWLIFGTNGHIGWGSTAGFGDTVDIYQEKLNPADPHQYFFQGEYRPMEKRVEAIAVKGGDPVGHEIYSTVHGPVVQFDVENGRAYSKKRSWAGSELTSLLAWMKASRAKSFKEWRGAISAVSIPINNYYVDARGNIGYTYLGKFPRRPEGQDFRLPASGTGEMEWQGFHPFEDSPWALNPARGYLANWNNKPQPNYNSSDGIYWGALDRLAEIDALLDNDGKQSVDEVWGINERISFRDTNARFFMPLIAKAAETWPADSTARKAAGLLAQWDGMTVDRTAGSRTSPAYTLFRTFLPILIQDNLAPHYPVNALRAGAYDSLSAISPISPTMGTKAVYNALLGAKAGVPQKVDMLGGKTPAEALRLALESAVMELTAKYSADPASWAEPATPHVFRARNYAGIPHTVGNNELKLPAAMNRGTENNRIVFGPKGKVSYCDVTTPGQSGFIRPDGTPSPHVRDQLALYGSFGCKEQWLRPADVDRNSKGNRTLDY